ncbi:MAG: 50S ribosomal protein L18 [Candidatus Marsarchaeota archaeon]|nr:50S ribosomal protein L18 [Candidatus Marsarchaeota archaeon]
MATGPRYRVSMKRRRIKLTNYRRRLRLLSSQKHRLVVRRSNRYTYAQLIRSEAARDSVDVSASSRELGKLGYLAGLNSASAAYLTGLLIGKRSLAKGVHEAVLDIGPYSNVPKSNVYAVVKGCLDAGLDIPHSEDMVPSSERLEGKHIASYASSLKSSDESRYQKVFSKMLESGIKPENLDSLVQNVRSRLDEIVGGTSV